MCYSPDGGDRNQGGNVLDCAGRLHLDCGHDDYFDTAPEAGEYLASRWNIGSRVNRFLSFGGAAENAAPVARDDAAIAEKSVARGVVVLANDPDPDGDPVTITAVANRPAAVLRSTRAPTACATRPIPATEEPTPSPTASPTGGAGRPPPRRG